MSMFQLRPRGANVARMKFPARTCTKLEAILIGALAGGVVAMFGYCLTLDISNAKFKALYPYSEAHYNSRGYFHMSEGYYRLYGTQQGDTTVRGITPNLETLK